VSIEVSWEILKVFIADKF